MARIRTPTPEEATIVTWLLILLTAVLGIVSLYYSTQVELPEEAFKFRGRGIVCLCISFGIWVGSKALRYFFD